MTINEENINEIIRRYNSVPIYFRNLIEEKERLKSNECKHYDREEFVEAWGKTGGGDLKFVTLDNDAYLYVDAYKIDVDRVIFYLNFTSTAYVKLENIKMVR